jgi:Leu/Phe-tRNA-protein transferase
VTRRVLRLALRSGVWKPVNAVVALVEESKDPVATADEATIRLSEMLPLDASVLVARYIEGFMPFGYYHTDDAYYWRRVEQRGLITREVARVPSGARRRLAKHDFDIRFDIDSEEIIERCRRTEGTWLNRPMIRALHDGLAQGVVATVGAYDTRGSLVGGEFGLYIAGWYWSMSTFHTVSNAGNALFAHVVNEVKDGGRFVVCDVGELKPHSLQFGAVPVSLDAFRRDVLVHLSGRSQPNQTSAP